MEHVIDKILVSEKEMGKIVRQISDKIIENYHNIDNILVFYVLEGAKFFATNLKNNLSLSDQKFHFAAIKANSYYHSTTSSGEVKLDLMGNQEMIKGSHILVVDDIFDTGNTLTKIKNQLEELGAISVKTCVMIERYCENPRQIEVDFKGITLSTDEFLIGCGLDYQGHLRELPYIATVKKEYQCVEA